VRLRDPRQQRPHLPSCIGSRSRGRMPPRRKSLLLVRPQRRTMRRFHDLLNAAHASRVART
jgi:hypothetical protein